ncbi:TetR/AcrR family transcriptional regulator [Saccharopolyspora sp. K220]|uniref:TetR/AcrR family transcriptional regulator n=1 Tax=Saccharopolyspora soli TaxID=2926618 RepID=UPI001F567A94|nr:TetR/AcrR family transcriptional regulator [Saccharopolyspora soli]MCI2418334.1 TetR/AcrR family transcriptional regulator [Saccharopolyspora soli]
MSPTGRPEKRRAIERAARKVFGRDGYTRASVDAIAAEAQVSKRTIYNHFTDKEQLFLSVALDGAQEVTDAIARQMELHLRKIVDLEEDLVAFSRDRVATVTQFPDHFALVRALEAEVTRIPPPVLEKWLAAGPQSAHLRLAPYLRGLADRGLLAIDDAEQAAQHLNLLTVTSVLQRTFYGSIPMPAEEADEIITSGVRAFLRLYAPTGQRSGLVDRQ